MSVKLKELTTPQIMVYAEMVSKQFDELYNFDVEVVMCNEWGGMLSPELEDIRKEIGFKMVDIENSRVTLVKEINRRIKRDLGVKFGPSDVQPFINKYKKKNPLIGRGESETKARVKEGKQNKGKGKVIDIGKK